MNHMRVCGINAACALGVSTALAIAATVAGGCARRPAVEDPASAEARRTAEVEVHEESVRRMAQLDAEIELAAVEAHAASDRGDADAADAAEGCPADLWWSSEADERVCSDHAAYLSERARRLDAIEEARDAARVSVAPVRAAEAELAACRDGACAELAMRERSRRIAIRRTAIARADALASELVDFDAAHVEAEAEYHAVHARHEAELSDRAVSLAEGIEAEAEAEAARRAGLSPAERAREDRAAEREARREAAAEAAAAAEREAAAAAAAEAAACRPYPERDAPDLPTPRCRRRTPRHVTTDEMMGAAEGFEVLRGLARTYAAANTYSGYVSEEGTFTLCDMSGWQRDSRRTLLAMARGYDCICAELYGMSRSERTCEDDALRNFVCYEGQSLASRIWELSTSAEWRAREVLDPSLVDGMDTRADNADLCGAW